MEFKQLSDWIIVDGHCATRVKIGGNPDNVEERVAFIEKTPRVRINKNKYCVERKNEIGCSMLDNDAWLYGEKGSTEYGRDKSSRKWCDDMLALLGWE
ncbi:hypothetical protein GCM10023310_70450 [Paenibacillus vulneris]|uniref:Uncharacterized protein n=1 Tax=Paenibacillus vulneris TaxID=1133364 RepID=A0ABW3UGH2_9BACL